MVFAFGEFLFYNLRQIYFKTQINSEWYWRFIIKLSENLSKRSSLLIKDILLFPMNSMLEGINIFNVLRSFLFRLSFISVKSGTLSLRQEFPLSRRLVMGFSRNSQSGLSLKTNLSFHKIIIENIQEKWNISFWKKEIHMI